MDGIATLDDQKRVIFYQFKEAVSDCPRPNESDDYLLKWLIARDFDVHKAEQMLRKSMEWRLINQIDGILDNWKPPEVLVKYYAIGSPGYDKFGCPVLICPFGRIDVRGILQSVSKRDYVRYIAYIAEKNYTLVGNENLLKGNTNTYTTFVLDMDQLAARQISYKPFMDVGMETTRMSEANYPEGVRRVFLLNVPQVFTAVFNVIKPFLGKATLDKIRVFGADKQEWSSALLEEIEADQLPVHYGGTMTDPDGNPMCLSKIIMGGEVPHSYYRINQEKPIPRENMTLITVGAGAKKSVHVQNNQNNSVLKWEFMTEEADIGFQIFYLKDNKEEIVVLPSQRVDSHLTIEEGAIGCAHQGTYVFEFDNTYSYFNSKKVWQHVAIQDPSRLSTLATS